MIGNEEYVSNTIEVLKAFLWHGTNISKDKRKLDGYGLKMEEFLHKFKNEKNESYSSATKRMFVARKNELLSNRYITRIRSKGKQSKYYAITPIGIAYLFQKYEPPSDLVTECFNQVIKHLIFYHEITKPKPGYAKLLESHKIFQIYSNNELNENKSIRTLQAIFKIMKYVKISHDGSNLTNVTLSYPLGLDTDLHYGKYEFIHKITSEKTKIIKGKKIITKGFKEVKNVTDWFVEIHLPFQKIDKKIIPFQEYVHTTEKEIYQKIATFIIKAFFYKSITNKIYFYEFVENH